MAALLNMISVEQFLQLPEGGEYAYELYHGEVVALTRPKAGHTRLQLLLSSLLGPKLKSFGQVACELPYCPVGEFELRAADVAAISRKRWDAVPSDDYLRGAPELVIEVKSPSNTRRQLQELRALCLANGASEFWVVDADASTVSVFRSPISVVVYAAGSFIPLASFGGGELAVDEIFALVRLTAFHISADVTGECGRCPGLPPLYCESNPEGR